MKKRILSLMMAGAMVLSMTACGSKETTADTSKAETEVATEASESSEAGEAADEAASTDDKVYKIGVLQLVQHAALDAANEGFIAALNDAGIKYEVDQKNASGEQSNCQTIAEKLVNDGNDLILAIATPAAQAVAGVTTEIPIVLTAVTDPAESGLVEDNAAPGGNVTGTSDLTPVKEQVGLLQQLIPEAKTVGILYCSAETNSQIQAQMAKEALAELGIETIEQTVSQSNDIQSAVEALVGKVDVIYAPTDNMIAAGMATVGMIAEENKIPVICGESGMVNAGGLATYGIDYYQLGYMAGEQAVEILVNGKNPAELPIGYLPAEKCELTINEEFAAAVGIDVSSIQ
ncbi:MAG: ABC transporter substrate-binding protein [Lachnospiraceae bacterium]